MRGSKKLTPLAEASAPPKGEAPPSTTTFTSNSYADQEHRGPIDEASVVEPYAGRAIAFSDNGVMRSVLRRSLSDSGSPGLTCLQRYSRIPNHYLVCDVCVSSTARLHLQDCPVLL